MLKIKLKTESHVTSKSNREINEDAEEEDWESSEIDQMSFSARQKILKSKGRGFLHQPS